MNFVPIHCPVCGKDLEHAPFDELISELTGNGTFAYTFKCALCTSIYQVSGDEQHITVYAWPEHVRNPHLRWVASIENVGF